MSKLTTKVLTKNINQRVLLADEQKDFQSGRFCREADFFLSQIAEKSIEYNRPPYLCFADLERASTDLNIKLLHVNFIADKLTSLYIIVITEEMYTGNMVHAKTTYTNQLQKLPGISLFYKQNVFVIQSSILYFFLQNCFLR